MPRYRVSPAAERDIEAILTWTHEQFGTSARIRYEALLVRAILDVAADPDRPGGRPRPDIAADARTYHLYYSRNRVPPPAARVRQPRHLLLYRIRDDGKIEIGRVLHESMDLVRHLPEEYRPGPVDEISPEQT
jgi:toxin ParE1/3/4